MVEMARTEELGKRASEGARAIEKITREESGRLYGAVPSLRASTYRIRRTRGSASHGCTCTSKTGCGRR